MQYFLSRCKAQILLVINAIAIVCLLSMGCLPVQAVAAENALMPFDQSGLVFSRQKLTIIASGALPEELIEEPQALPKDKDGKTIVYQQGKDDKDKKDTINAPQKAAEVKAESDAPPLRAIDYSVEVRDESAYRLESIPSLNYLNDSSAFMVVQNPSQMVNVGMLRASMPIDLIMVKKNGRILAMMPEVKFIDLQSDIDAGEEVVAVLFLKGGQIKDRAIQPGDEVQHKIFAVPPKVLR